jgi:hypothetical protein
MSEINQNENDITDLFDDDAFEEAKSNLEKNDTVYRQNDEFQYRKEQKKRAQPTIKQKITIINGIVWLIFEALWFVMTYLEYHNQEGMPVPKSIESLGLFTYTGLWISFLYLAWFSLSKVILCDSDFDLLVTDPNKKFMYPFYVLEEAWWSIIPNIIFATLAWRAAWVSVLDENNTFYYAIIWAPVVIFVYNGILFLTNGEGFSWRNLLWIGNAVVLIVALVSH